VTEDRVGPLADASAQGLAFRILLMPFNALGPSLASRAGKRAPALRYRTLTFARRTLKTRRTPQRSLRG
jgi:hypothetical protein